MGLFWRAGQWIVKFLVEGGPSDFPSQWNAGWVGGRGYSGVTDYRCNSSNMDS